MTRYQVYVENEPMQDFTNIDSAIDYASSHVYLDPKLGRAVKFELENNKSVKYSYGFKSVELKPIEN